MPVVRRLDLVIEVFVQSKGINLRWLPAPGSFVTFFQAVRRLESTFGQSRINPLAFRIRKRDLNLSVFDYLFLLYHIIYDIRHKET